MQLVGLQNIRRQNSIECCGNDKIVKDVIVLFMWLLCSDKSCYRDVFEGEREIGCKMWEIRVAAVDDIIKWRISFNREFCMIVR